MYGKLFLRHEGKKIATPMKTNNLEQWTIASLEISEGKQNKTGQELCLITNNTVTVPPYHISIALLRAINHVINNTIKSNSFIEKEENPFLFREQPDLILMPVLQKLGPQRPNVCMALLWNPDCETVILKRNTVIGCVRESAYMGQSPTDQ